MHLQYQPWFQWIWFQLDYRVRHVLPEVKSLNFLIFKTILIISFFIKDLLWIITYSSSSGFDYAFITPFVLAIDQGAPCTCSEASSLFFQLKLSFEEFLEKSGDGVGSPFTVLNSTDIDCRKSLSTSDTAFGGFTVSVCPVVSSEIKVCDILCFSFNRKSSFTIWWNYY